MSKENQNNTPYESSIKPLAEGVEAAQESNTKPLQSSINTPIKALENPLSPRDEPKPLPNDENQPKQQQEKRVLANSKSMFALRAATLGAAGAAFVVKGVGVAVQASKGDLSIKEAGAALSDLGGGVAKAFGPADKLLEQKGKIKEERPPTPGLYDKALDKIRTFRGGVLAANVIDKTFKTVTSKSVLRAAKIGGAIVSAVTTPPPVGIVLGTLSLTRIFHKM